jgi:hypothetical protein
MLMEPKDVLHPLCASLSVPTNHTTGMLLEVKFDLLISTADRIKYEHGLGQLL